MLLPSLLAQPGGAAAWRARCALPPWAASCLRGVERAAARRMFFFSVVADLVFYSMLSQVTCTADQCAISPDGFTINCKTTACACAPADCGLSECGAGARLVGVCCRRMGHMARGL